MGLFLEGINTWVWVVWMWKILPQCGWALWNQEDQTEYMHKTNESLLRESKTHFCCLGQQNPRLICLWSLGFISATPRCSGFQPHYDLHHSWTVSYIISFPASEAFGLGLDHALRIAVSILRMAWFETSQLPWSHELIPPINSSLNI